MINLAGFLQSLETQAISFTENENLAAHCTFKIGGPAEVFCQAGTVSQLATILRLCKSHEARYLVLGKGSNVLFADNGFQGVVIQLAGEFATIACDGKQIIAGAAVNVADLCCAARDASLAGLEFAFGIPGSVGGGIFMNAGAYGGEMADVLTSVTYMDDAFKTHTVDTDALALGYRESVFQHQPWIILSAVFTLTSGNREEIGAHMRELAKNRAEKQPLDKPSAGSAFKRPVGAFAAALIDKAGLRGYTHGGAGISEKHCGFIVNLGGASAEDVLCLADEVCNAVKEKTGYCLEKEIRVIK